MFVPCNYVHDYLGYENDSVHEECVPDLKAQQQYLGPMLVPMLFNEEVLITDSFG